MEPRCLGTFLLEKQVGRGGMGVVYRARCLKDGRVVAVKLLPNDIESNYRKRFAREMEVLRSLRHPHIVRYYDGQCDNKHCYYAMEFVEHGTLAALLQRRGQLNWDEAVDYALQVCSALEYMHERGIVHRDLKPGNLLIGSDGQLKLSDFGVAWVVDGQHLTREGRTVGSFAYMSPEQISGSDKLSASSDLYALGCLLFEMIAGQRVFGEKIGPPVLLDHLRTKPPNVRQFAMNCPIQLANLIAQLLEKTPASRPKDAGAVMKVLNETRTTPEFVHLPETEVVSTPDVRPTVSEFPGQLWHELPQLWHELPAAGRKWIAIAGLIVLGVTIGLGLRSDTSESPRAQVTQSDGSKRTLQEPPPESWSVMPVLMFFVTVSVLGGLAAHLRKLNREEEALAARKAARTVVPRRSRERDEAQHYLDDLQSSVQFH
ncbi:MAG: serine/threonine protein kinase [Planctomycetaceae bacterium]|nr:serine/threonine protein kinase [Planctomycetaceae bacterium]